MTNLNPIDLAGDPAAVRANAQGWQELSTKLREHSSRITQLVGHTRDGWSSPARKAFVDSSMALAESCTQASDLALLVASQHHQHADHQQVVVEVLKELAIQLAATLAMWAAAAYLPPLLAAIEAYLEMILTQLGRIASVIHEMLRAFTAFLIRVRTWIVQLSKTAWRTERFSIGYGKILYEGIRDGLQDLTSNLISSEIQGKPIDPALLFVSAGASAAGGGLAGLVEASGTKKLVVAGEIEMAGGRPKFVSNVDRFRATLRDVGKKPNVTEDAAIHAADAPFHTEKEPIGGVPIAAEAENMIVSEAPVIGELTDGIEVTEVKMTAEPTVAPEPVGNPGIAALNHHLEVRAAARDLPRLEAELTQKAAVREAAEVAYRQASRAAAEARTVVNDAQRFVGSARSAADDAFAHLALSEGRLHRVGSFGEEQLTEHAQQQLTDAAARYGQRVENLQTAEAAYVTAQDQYQAAVTNLDVSVGQLTDARAEFDALAERVPTLQHMNLSVHEAREAVFTNASWRQRAAYVGNHNPWQEGYVTRYEAKMMNGDLVLKPQGWQKQQISPFGELPVKGYGAAKDWREVVIHNGIKGIIKGCLSNTIVSAWEQAMGLIDGDRIWKDAALGAAFGATRGMIDGAGINRTYFQGSLEEVVWRAGTKGLDRTIRAEITPLIGD